MTGRDANRMEFRKRRREQVAAVQAAGTKMSLFRLLRPGSGMRKGGSPRHALGV